MAVVELDRDRVRAIQAAQVAQRMTPQIFFAHTSLSKRLLKKIGIAIKKGGVRPFIANLGGYGVDAVEGIIRAICASDALFVVLTKNALRRRFARDWVSFEIGLAGAAWRNLTAKTSKQYKIFGWKETGIRLSSSSPIKGVVDYKPINLRSKRSREAMLEEMRAIAQDISIISKI